MAANMYYSYVRQMNSGKKTDLICENDFLFPRQSANLVYYLLHLVLEYLVTTTAYRTFAPKLTGQPLYTVDSFFHFILKSPFSFSQSDVLK